MVFEKGQVARIVDILVIGPFLIWVAYSHDCFSAETYALLFAFGIGTIIYNLFNFLGNLKIISFEINDYIFGAFTLIVTLILFFIKRNQSKFSLQTSFVA